MLFVDVKVKVFAQKGECPFSHKVGDEWVVGPMTPVGICNGAYNAIYPFIRILQFGGKYEWPQGSGVIRVCCPDPFNPVIFELTKKEDNEREL